MSDGSGVPRQALSLVLGGLSERLRSGRRGAVVLAAGAVAAGLLVGGLAVSDVGTVDVEVEQCAGCSPRPRRPSSWRSLRRERCLRPRKSPARRRAPSSGSWTGRFPIGPAAAWSPCAAATSRACDGFGWADRSARVPADCDTVFDIGSLTKQFTAAAVVKLEMLGRLSVRDPIGRWLGPVPPDKASITVQQLLTHTSGLVASLGGDYERLSRRGMVARALASAAADRPRAPAYHYSNVGYSLLAAIIERASGMTYERFLARRLLRPRA